MGAGVSRPADLTVPPPPPDDWTNRWVESKHKSDFGKFVLSSGKFYGDQEKDKGKRRQGVGVEIRTISWRKLQSAIRAWAFPRNPGAKDRWGKEGEVICALRGLGHSGPPDGTLPSHHRAADKSRCPVLRAVR